jgi:hypothetical protein
MQAAYVHAACRSPGSVLGSVKTPHYVYALTMNNMDVNIATVMFIVMCF